MFTKRHYEQIAETIRQTKANGGRTFVEVPEIMVPNAVNGVRNKIATELADMFGKDNPRFNRKMFLAACDVTEVK